MTLKIYLSGEIHTDWREQIIEGAKGLDVEFSAPVTDHAASDDCGVAILGAEPDKFWHDHKGAKLNAIRTRKGITDADVVVVRFGEKYKQWNAAFDAGYAAALGKSLIVLHGADHQHALKEIDAAALVVATKASTPSPLACSGVMSWPCSSSNRRPVASSICPMAWRTPRSTSARGGSIVLRASPWATKRYWPSITSIRITLVIVLPQSAAKIDSISRPLAIASTPKETHKSLPLDLQSGGQAADYKSAVSKKRGRRL